MTNQPLEPFQVQSNLLQNATPAGGVPSAGGVGKAGGPGGNTRFSNFDRHQARWLALIVFLAIYWAAQQDPLLRPMTILVLLACLLLRTEGRSREIAGVPLALAAVKLALSLIHI